MSKCRTCAELGDKVLVEMCEELGTECRELEKQLRAGKITSREFIDRLKGRYDPNVVSALVTRLARKHRGEEG